MLHLQGKLEEFEKLASSLFRINENYPKVTNIVMVCDDIFFAQQK